MRKSFLILLLIMQNIFADKTGEIVVINEALDAKDFERAAFLLAKARINYKNDSAVSDAVNDYANSVIQKLADDTAQPQRNMVHIAEDVVLLIRALFLDITRNVVRRNVVTDIRTATEVILSLLKDPTLRFSAEEMNTAVNILRDARNEQLRTQHLDIYNMLSNQIPVLDQAIQDRKAAPPTAAPGPLYPTLEKPAPAVPYVSTVPKPTPTPAVPPTQPFVVQPQTTYVPPKPSAPEEETVVYEGEVFPEEKEVPPPLPPRPAPAPKPSRPGAAPDMAQLSTRLMKLQQDLARLTASMPM